MSKFHKDQINTYPMDDEKLPHWSEGNGPQPPEEPQPQTLVPCPRCHNNLQQWFLEEHLEKHCLVQPSQPKPEESKADETQNELSNGLGANRDTNPEPISTDHMIEEVRTEYAHPNEEDYDEECGHEAIRLMWAMADRLEAQAAKIEKVTLQLERLLYNPEDIPHSTLCAMSEKLIKELRLK